MPQQINRINSIITILLFIPKFSSNNIYCIYRLLFLLPYWASLVAYTASKGLRELLKRSDTNPTTLEDVSTSTQARGTCNCLQSLQKFSESFQPTHPTLTLLREYSEVIWGACSPSLISDTHLKPRHIGSLRSLLTKLRLVLSQSKPRLKLCRWLGGNVQRIKHSLFYTVAPFIAKASPLGFWEFPSYADYLWGGIKGSS